MVLVLVPWVSSCCACMTGTACFVLPSAAFLQVLAVKKAHGNTITNKKCQCQFQQLSTSQTIEIPIFPLRKFPRLPTDRLTLNLYEERYLQMAEFILSSTPPYFGAIYVAGKPQLVSSGGRGPIVPILQSGDIGTLFRVCDSEENMVPTIGNQIVRRRIKLNAIGISRFRIVSIVSDGSLAPPYFGDDPEQRCYIRANVTLFSDNHDPTSNPWTQHEYERLILSLKTYKQQKWFTFLRQPNNDSMDQLLEFPQVFAAIQNMKNDDIGLLYNFDELFSFYAVSRLLTVNEENSPSNLVSFLESQSTNDRITKLLDVIGGN